jgi:hypothetical protein
VEYATTRPFFAMEVTPITANATIHSSRLKLKWATDLGRVISFAAQRSELEKPKNAEAIELVLRGEAVSKQLSSRRLMAGARQLLKKMLKLQTGQVSMHGLASPHLSGNEQRRERAEPLSSRARYR